MEDTVYDAPTDMAIPSLPITVRIPVAPPQPPQTALRLSGDLTPSPIRQTMPALPERRFEAFDEVDRREFRRLMIWFVVLIVVVMVIVEFLIWLAGLPVL